MKERTGGREKKYQHRGTAFRLLRVETAFWNFIDRAFKGLARKTKRISRKHNKGGVRK